MCFQAALADVPQIAPAFPRQCGMCSFQGKSPTFSTTSPHPFAHFQVNSTQPQGFGVVVVTQGQGSEGWGSHRPDFQ